MTADNLSSAAKAPATPNKGAGEGSAHSEDIMNAQVAAAEPTNIIVAVNDNPSLVLLDAKRFEQFYEAIKDETDKLVADVSTPKGRDAIKAMAFKVTKTKTAIDAAGKVLKEDAQATVNKVDAARREIKNRLEALKDEVRAPLDAWEAAEDARIANCEAMIKHIEECGRGFIGGELQPFGILIRELEEKVVIDASFKEYEAEAIRARDAALDRLRTAMEAQRQADADRAELERLRAEAAERVAREQAAEAARMAAEAEKERQAEEARAAEAVALKVKADLEEAALRAERAATAAAEAKAKEEADAAAKAHADALAAEKRRADDAEAARQAEADRIAQVEQAREAEVARLKAAADARAADIEHRSKIMGAAKAAIMSLGVGETAAKSIVLAIAAGDIPAVTIQF